MKYSLEKKENDDSLFIKISNENKTIGILVKLYDLSFISSNGEQKEEKTPHLFISLEKNNDQLVLFDDDVDFQ
jgi:hypothetical protein